MDFHHYKLRVTFENIAVTRDTVFTSLEKWTKMLAAVDEGGVDDVKIHTHYYLVTDIKEATLRKRLRGLLGTGGVGRGNAVFSLSLLTLSDESDFCVEYCGYMYKSGNEIIATTSFPKEWLKAGVEHNILIQKQLKEEKKAKRRTQLQHLQESFDQDLKTCPEKVISDRSRTEVDEVDIIRYVYDWWAQKDTLIRESTIVAQVQTLAIKYIASYKEKFMSRILQKIL